MSFPQILADTDDLKILEALKTRPDLKICVLEMIDITEYTIQKLDRGDDVVNPDWIIDNCLPVHFFPDDTGRWRARKLI